MKIATSFCAEKELLDRVQVQAKKENRTFSNFVETALIEYLKKSDKTNGGNKNENV